MLKLSPARLAWPVLDGIDLKNRGKVRDMYDLGNGYYLIVATDAVSIFDFVLNAMIPDKGRVLNVVSHFWLLYFEMLGFKTHLVAVGRAIDEYLPKHRRGDPDLQSRSMVVRKLNMYSSREFIGRVCLTGTGLKEYRAIGSVCGTPLPLGLQDGDLLPYILDTPTTKAEVGHDKPVSAAETRETYAQATILTLKLIDAINKKAQQRGFILADSKFEFGEDELGNVVLGDEAGTPDSSRYWLFSQWQAGRQEYTRKAPTAHDKQFVREWGKLFGLDDTKQFDPENEDDVRRAHELVVPNDVIAETTSIYRGMTLSLTTRSLDDYLNHIGVRVN